MKKGINYRFYQYGNHVHSFVADLMPAQAMDLKPHQVLYLLERRYGLEARDAFQYQLTIVSSKVKEQDSTWMRSTNIVGVNIRTIGSFWNLVKYALTLPNAQSAIHILPIWECGVVASLYGMASWNVNEEFFSQELAWYFPHLDSVEKQLKVVVNLLHLMGKSVGVDVIPHTDRFSEIVLANPWLFEWLQRDDITIVNHSANLHLEVQAKILDFIALEGSATYNLDFVDDLKNVFFTEQFPEYERLRVLFGEKEQLAFRNYRRNLLIQFLYEAGFETVPATMGPPYRGIKVDISENAKVIDQDGRVWRDFIITKPEQFSRVFGPLARYKLHEAKNDNANWELDFSKPRKDVFEYVGEKYAEVARLYNFDFMRGDMSHVQMREEGVPKQTDEFYDILKYIKIRIQKEKPHFGYFAESFLAPDDVMAYGSEVAHLQQSLADSTLGDLQSAVVGSEEFMTNFVHYYSILQQGKVAPSFTIMTGDKDDPRFDSFYVNGNELRYFISLFLHDMPSYMGLGFECRDTHLTPAANEHYTKLYVFQINEGEKATFAPYHWGKNERLFLNLQAIKLLSEKICPLIDGKKIIWHKPIALKHRVIEWAYEGLAYSFVVNLDLEKQQVFDLTGEIIFSTVGLEENRDYMMPGECLVLMKE